MDDIINEFLTETNEGLAELDNALVSLEQNPEDSALISQIFRVIHTIKGTSGFLGLVRLGHVAHKGEDVLGLFRDKKLKVTPAYVSLILEAIDRIKQIIIGIETTGSEPEGDDTHLISQLEAVYNGAGGGVELSNDSMNILDEAPIAALDPMEAAFAAAQPLAVQETVHQDKVEVADAKANAAAPAESQLASQTLRVNVEVLENLMTMVSELVLTRNQLLQTARNYNESEILAPLQRLNHVVSGLQDGVMKTRMQPIGNAWSKLPRIVRDVAAELGKKIDLEMRGQETELDRQILEMIKDPLTHMVRNSADHGVELPAERAAKGKSETGKILLNAYHQGGHIIVEISDDGKGLPLDKIKKKILERGLATEEQLRTMPAQQIQQYIFHAGFSTADKITSVSGRGVGMDVVRSNIEKIGGSIEMKSVENHGTTFLIKIPLTLAIVSSLIVGVNNERFAVPQITVSELVCVGGDSAHQVELIDNAPVLRLRGNLLPLVSLNKLLNLPHHEDKNKVQYVVVTRVAAFLFGLIVDQVFDMEEIVVKPVSDNLKDLQIFSGNTILGDGRVIMILDPPGILKAAGMEQNLENAQQAQEEKLQIQSGPENLLLLFNDSHDQLKAAPIDMVSRLEEVELKNIEMSDGRQVIQYLGHLMPIFGFENDNLERRPLIIFRDGDRNAALMANKILDITTYYGDLRMETNGSILDSVIVNGKAVDVINPSLFTAQGVVLTENA